MTTVSTRVYTCPRAPTSSSTSALNLGSLYTSVTFTATPVSATWPAIPLPTGNLNRITQLIIFQIFSNIFSITCLFTTAGAGTRLVAGKQGWMCSNNLTSDLSRVLPPRHVRPPPRLQARTICKMYLGLSPRLGCWAQAVWASNSIQSLSRFTLHKVGWFLCRSGRERLGPPPPSSGPG